MREQYIIVAYIDGELERWDGHYGWFPIPRDMPTAIGGAKKYKSRKDAERALTRMRSRNPLRRRPNLARVYQIDEVWLNDTELNMALLTGASTTGA